MSSGLVLDPRIKWVPPPLHRSYIHTSYLKPLSGQLPLLLRLRLPAAHLHRCVSGCVLQLSKFTDTRAGEPLPTLDSEFFDILHRYSFLTAIINHKRLTFLPDTSLASTTSSASCPPPPILFVTPS